MTTGRAAEVPEPPIDPEDFEAIVAAALKVDPKGITRQKAAPQDEDVDES